MASGTPLHAPDRAEAVADLFYAGHYLDVLGATLDSRDGYRAEDLAFVVGALAFAGRVAEAELLFAGARRDRAPARTLAAGAFFLCAAQSRVGRFDEARAHLRRALADTAGARDPWARALLLQGAACVRYFTGRPGRAAAVAGAALGCAQRAGFAYGQMLANDLRGHALAQSGRAAEGFAVLRHARDQARRLGYEGNARAIEVSLAIHRARLAAPADAVTILAEAAGREDAQDSYSRRTLYLEIAPLLAWTGRASEAARLVGEAAALCAGERRQQAWLAIVRAQVARVREGRDAARAQVDAAERWSGADGDPAHRAEIAALRLALAHAAGDEAPLREAERALRSLAAETGLWRARMWLDVYGRGDQPAGRRDDGDAMTPLLAAVARGSVATAVRAGLLGLVPEAAGLAPGRRVHVFDDALLVEDHGDVEQRPALSERLRDVLLAVADGHSMREDLLRTAWGLRGYAPERHDTLIKTAVSRLREALGPAGAWVASQPGGYRLADGVEVVRHDPAKARSARPHAAESSPPTAADLGRNERQRRIVEALEGARSATVGELSRRLREPLRTVSRELSRMCDDAVLAREGAGRATSYRLRDPKEPGGP